MVEVNHIIWAWSPLPEAVAAAAAGNRYARSHAHVLFFAKKGAERTFNRFCRFAESDRTETGGSACYADMEDVWDFGESFGEAVPRASIPLVQKILSYCANRDDAIIFEHV